MYDKKFYLKHNPFRYPKENRLQDTVEIKVSYLPLLAIHTWNVH